MNCPHPPVLRAAPSASHNHADKQPCVSQRPEQDCVQEDLPRDLCAGFTATLGFHGGATEEAGAGDRRLAEDSEVGTPGSESQLCHHGPWSRARGLALQGPVFSFSEASERTCLPELLFISKHRAPSRGRSSFHTADASSRSATQSATITLTGLIAFIYIAVRVPIFVSGLSSQIT